MKGYTDRKILYNDPPSPSLPSTFHPMYRHLSPHSLNMSPTAALFSCSFLSVTPTFFFVLICLIIHLFLVTYFLFTLPLNIPMPL